MTINPDTETQIAEFLPKALLRTIAQYDLMSDFDIVIDSADKQKTAIMRQQLSRTLLSHTVALIKLYEKMKARGALSAIAEANMAETYKTHSAAIQEVQAYLHVQEGGDK